MDNDEVHLAEWRRLLDERGVTLTDFAAAMGTPLWTVYSYSQDKRTPSDEWQRRAETVARTLGAAPKGATA